MSRKRKETWDWLLVREATWPHHGYYYTSHVESQTTSTKKTRPTKGQLEKNANKGTVGKNGQQRASGKKMTNKGPEEEANKGPDN